MNINASLRDVEIENIIWVIYLFIIGANFISNYYVEKYLYTMDETNRKIFRTINIAVLTILLLLYIYFVYISYEGVKKEDKTYRKLLLLGSVLILIGGIIYLGVEIYKNENPEVAIL